MNEAQVRAWLAEGEGPQIEFKERYSSRALETLVAFANTDGGQVLLGVNDAGRIVGIADPDKVVESVLSACREAISPPITPLVEIVWLAEGAVVVAQVQPSGRMHTKSGAVFVRHGRQTRKATHEEIWQLTLRERPEVYERQPATGAQWSDLDIARLREYFRARAPRAESVEASLSELAIADGFAVVSAGQTLPTIAGMVLFGREPQRYNASWGITALRIRGQELDRNRVVDRRELTGPADALIEAALRFVRDHMQVAYQFAPADARRREIPAYSLDAVREAVANAVAHREYHPAEQSQLRVFDDRLEVQNPGGLLSGLTLEEVLRGGMARRRNEIISEVLRQWGYVEKVGFGLVFIRQRMRELGAAEPRFEATPSHFIVTMPARTLPVDTES